MNNSLLQPFGEVIISTLTEWTIHCWEIDRCPPFGSLIEIPYEQITYIGIITNIQTHPKDGNRVPFAFGKTKEELKEEHPHIFQLLKTLVTCVPLAYQNEDKKIIYEIPKMPPYIHAFVAPCSQALMNNFFIKTAWMIPFFNLIAQNPLFDELLIAAIRNGYTQNSLDKKSMKEIIDIFSLLTHSDYRKLKIFLQRIEAFIQ